MPGKLRGRLADVSLRVARDLISWREPGCGKAGGGGVASGGKVGVGGIPQVSQSTTCETGSCGVG